MKELITIQSTLNAPKGQYNSFGKYNYRSCEDILKAVKPLLTQNGCTLTISDDVVLVGNRIYIKATATLTNGSGEKEVTTAYAREEETKKGMDGSQVTGAASSYARKYALNGLFAIDDNKDADTLNSNPQYTQQPQAPFPPQQQQSEELTPSDILQGYALPAIQQALTKEDLKRIYEGYPDLQQHADFLSALTARRKALGV
ncbi:MAG: ERF family protein [Bacteroidaceae bacterium]|nr:ERF family protein [Bacteroidaceae bacterium]